MKGTIMRMVHRAILPVALVLPFMPFAVEGAKSQTTSTLSVGPVDILGDEPSYGDIGLGAFDIQGHRESGTSAEARAEFRYGKKLFYIGPAIGVLGNTSGGIFGYAGVYGDLALGPHIILTPLAAVGAYRRGGSEDLGGAFAFRLSANLAYQFDNLSRVGMQFAHISNAGIYNRNPGENELLVTYAVPLNLPF
jgi:hypothetical protein